MGVKVLQCFPFYRRCKERCKGRQCPPAAVPIEEMKPRLSSTTSWSSDGEGPGSLSRGSQIYFSTKARLSFRHQLDSNINAVDATYWGAGTPRECRVQTGGTMAVRLPTYASKRVRYSSTNSQTLTLRWRELVAHYLWSPSRQNWRDFWDGFKSQCIKEEKLPCCGVQHQPLKRLRTDRSHCSNVASTGGHWCWTGNFVYSVITNKCIIFGAFFSFWTFPFFSTVVTCLNFSV